MPPVAGKTHIETRLGKILFEADGRNIKWLADRLGVTRQMAGQWVAGRQPIPRRRQAQILLHLESVGVANLFDEDGYATRLDP